MFATIQFRSKVACLVTTLLLVSVPVTAQQPSKLTAGDPRVQAAIQRGLGYLQRQIGQESIPYAALMTVASLKAGRPANAPEIQSALKRIESRFDSAGRYTPSEHHVYEAGVSLLALANADATGYKPRIETIAQFIIAQQGPQGDWDYPARSTGDTSISQYAILGLWEAARSGVTVPPRVWDRAAGWLVSRQLSDGSFTYHPREAAGNEVGTHSMTAAGTGSLHVIRLYLYPNAKDVDEPERKAARDRGKKFGVLEPVDPESDGDAKPQTDENYRPTVRLSAIDRAVTRGMDWLGGRFSVNPDISWKLYYLYGLERLAALAGATEINKHDWYTEGAAHLLATQANDGSWTNDSSGASAATSFSVLFLSQATAKMLHRNPAARRDARFGAGLLAGGRGLPDNLAEVQIERGDVKVRKLVGPIEELLAELENAQSQKIESVQAALVDLSITKDPEALVGQKERLVQLVRDPRPEVRRTAYYALGLTNDLRLVPILIAGLNDSDDGCVIEARNALRFISKKIPGYGPPDQFTAEERAAAITRWKQWQRTIRPYADRDDVQDGPVP